MPIQVIIADDHPLVRTGIRTELALHADIQVIGEALNGDEALQMARQLCPDVLILDIHMPGLRANRVLRELKNCSHPSRVLILTAYGDTATVTGMLRAGADGYLLKDDDPALIPEALRAIFSGKTWYSASISSAITSFQPAIPEISRSFTRRELEILEYLVRGLTNKQIAQEIDIAERTVEFHLGHVMVKVGAKTRVELAIWANEHWPLTG